MLSQLEQRLVEMRDGLITDVDSCRQLIVAAQLELQSLEHPGDRLAALLDDATQAFTTGLPVPVFAARSLQAIPSTRVELGLAIITVFSEPAEQIRRCLTSVRQTNPNLRIVLLADGPLRPELENDAALIRGKWLKRPECGGAWWRRFCEIGIASGCRYVLKVDPDTRFHGPVRSWPSGDFFGHLIAPGLSEEHIQGGCQGFTATFLQKILGAELPERPELFDPTGQSYGWPRPANNACLWSSDFSMRWMARQLQVSQTDWPEVLSVWQLTESLVAGPEHTITHPHKED